MWAALLGAVVGGFFALAGGFSVELRRDRRRQLTAARLVIVEFDRSRVEIFAKATKERLRVEQLNPDQMSEEELHGYLPGPHPKISADAWFANAAEFVGALDDDTFGLVEHDAHAVQSAGEYGFLIGDDDAAYLRGEIDRAKGILEPLTKPTWFDRHVWRL
jgi:hypothetical protein